MSEDRLPNGEMLNVVSLEKYFTDLCAAQMEGQQRYFEAQISAINEAVRVALDSVNARLAVANEFRASMEDMAKRLPTRQELQAVDQKVNKLENWQSKMEGMATRSSVMVAWVFSGIAALASIVALVRALSG